MTVEASYELVPSGLLTNGRVDFDEPDCSGAVPSECAADLSLDAVRVGVRLRCRQGSDDATAQVLEFGTAYPGYGCWFTYATLLDVASSEVTEVYVGPLRSNRKQGVAYAIRRTAADKGWTFKENGTNRGAAVLDSSYSTVTSVKGFVSVDAIPGVVMVPATVKLRAAYDFGDPSPWPAGWPASEVEGDGHLDATVVSESYGQCSFAVDLAAAPPAPPAPPPSAFENRENLDGIVFPARPDPVFYPELL